MKPFSALNVAYGAGIVGRGERLAGRAELLARKGASVRMQRPAELAPIPWCGVKASESSGELLHFGKIPRKIGQHLAKTQQNSGKICEIQIFVKIRKNSATFNEKN